MQKMQDYFTPDGWSNYKSRLEESGNLAAVIKQHSIVSAVATGVPRILSQGVFGGVYLWKVQVPLLVNYASPADVHQQPINVVMIVSRVSPVYFPQGIAISSFAESPGKATE